MSIDNKLILENSKSLNVLYVEDDNDLRLTTSGLFTNFFNHIDIAVDGVDGYEKYKSFLDRNNYAYDIVISDIKMPNMNGLEMSKKIRELDHEQSIIFTTAFNEAQYLGEAIEIGVDGFLNKPINLIKMKEVFYRCTQKIADKKFMQKHYQQIEEMNMLHIGKKDSSDFREAKHILDDLERNKENISRMWCDKQIVRDRLSSHGIDVEYFRTHFSIKVIEYFLSVIKGDAQVGNCPVVFVMLDFFKHKDLPLNDVFMICVHFKNSVTSYIFNKYTFNEELFEDVSLIVDKNFEGVVINYLKMKKCDEKIAQKMKPIEKKQEVKEIKTFDEVTNYVEYVLENDVYELQDLEEEIDNLAISVTSDKDLDVNDIVVLGSNIKRYGAILSNYPLFSELGNSIIKLGNSFQKNTQILYDDREKMANITALLEGFVNDLIVWRKEIFDNNIQNPYFLNDSFFSNVDTIIMFIEYDESQDSFVDADDVDFFDF